MAKPIDRFRDPLYINWLKAARALFCTAEGIRDFCERHMKEYQKDVISRLKCPTDTCTGGTGLCKDCEVLWKKELTSQIHTKTSPCWKNANVTIWDSSAWEVAKVYMTHGQKKVRSAAETDVVGLMQLVHTCGWFNSLVTNVKSFEKVKDIRNDVSHSVHLKVTDTQLGEYIKDMIVLLEDSKELQNDKKAQTAVKELRQIQDLPLEINDTTVLQTEKDNREVELVQIERDMWKTKLDEINKWEPGVTKEEINHALDFISKQTDLSEIFKDDIELLKTKMYKLEKRVTETEGKKMYCFILYQRCK
ncbi:hypothetical protein NP493_862g01003 [Ridgeia piscesae]|uniref:Uncharacterized protein n=1 Tax=Ridgeia piscesae TaxID=27915 RepID=A0AAD9KNC6_RIDPI|nr:hypothetical protein NP493_862g01003 [Ridgeia piscesae]